MNYNERAKATLAFLGVTAGAALDLTNKLGQRGVIDSYPLGSNTFLENHIGNFGISSFMAMAVLMLFSWVDAPKKAKDFATFAVVVGTNLVNEAILTRPNPELVGDMTVAIVSTFLMIASYPELDRVLKLSISRE